MPPPQLIQPLGKTPAATLTAADFAAGVTVQRKFNGVRCVAFLDGDAPVLYSRTGVRFEGSEQVRREVAAVLRAGRQLDPAALLAGAAPVPAAAAGNGAAAAGEGAAAAGDGAAISGRAYLDGELYAHGRPLQWISGQARRHDEDSLLTYQVFDVFFPVAIATGAQAPGRARQAWLDAAFVAARAGLAPGTTLDHVARVENFPAHSVEEIRAMADRFIAEGYEGAVARRDAAGYEYGYHGLHTANAVKVKRIHDEEFEVVGYAQGRRGKDVGAVVWVCRIAPAQVVDPDATQFSVVPKDMTLAQRKQLFRCLAERVPLPGGGLGERFERDFRGRMLTVQYPELSAANIPVQAKAVAFRTYEEGDDPVARAFRECDLV